MISPQVYLRRGKNASIKDRFDYMLLDRAKNGVKIYIILWHETKVAQAGLNSGYAEKYFKSLHSNFYVMKHPSLLPLIWGINYLFFLHL
jgi:phospholipase D1/2